MAAVGIGALGVRFHADDRRRFYGDVFSNPDGDINVVYLEPHIPIGWHRHQYQTDRLWIVQGVLRLRVFQDEPHRDVVEHILANMRGERDVISIPPNYYHGYEALTDDTIVLQCNQPKWTGEDEERLSFKEVPWT